MNLWDFEKNLNLQRRHHADRRARYNRRRFLVYGPIHSMAPEQRLPLDNERVDRYRFAATSADDHSIYEAEIRPDVWDYANRTFPKLIASGKVFTIRAELGQPFYDDLAMPSDGIPFDIAEDLSADSITAALRGFPSAVLHEWDGRRENPAVLGSYFINRCCLIPLGCSVCPTWTRRRLALGHHTTAQPRSVSGARTGLASFT